jgi:hypothetical protein
VEAFPHQLDGISFGPELGQRFRRLPHFSIIDRNCRPSRISGNGKLRILKRDLDVVVVSPALTTSTRNSFR